MLFAEAAAEEQAGTHASQTDQTGRCGFRGDGCRHSTEEHVAVFRTYENVAVAFQTAYVLTMFRSSRECRKRNRVVA